MKNDSAELEGRVAVVTGAKVVVADVDEAGFKDFPLASKGERVRLKFTLGILPRGD